MNTPLMMECPTCQGAGADCKACDGTGVYPVHLWVQQTQAILDQCAVCFTNVLGQLENLRNSVLSVDNSVSELSTSKADQQADILLNLVAGMQGGVA